jgi:hypothetical protein
MTTTTTLSTTIDESVRKKDAGIRGKICASEVKRIETFYTIFDSIMIERLICVNVALNNIKLAKTIAAAVTLELH